MEGRDNCKASLQKRWAYKVWEREKKEREIKRENLEACALFFANFLLDKTAFFLKHEKDTFIKKNIKKY